MAAAGDKQKHFGPLMWKRMKTLPPRFLSWGWGAAVVHFGENGLHGNMPSGAAASHGDGGLRRFSRNGPS